MDYVEFKIPERYISPLPYKRRANLEELLDKASSTILLDFKDNITIDSTGIYEIMRLNSMAFQKDISIILVNVSDKIFKTIKLLGVHKIIPIFEKKELAIRVLNKISGRSKEILLNIFLFHKDKSISVLLKNILNLYGFGNIYCISDRKNLLKYEEAPDSILIISNHSVESLLMSEIDILQKSFDRIVVSEIFTTLENDITGEAFEIMLEDIMKIFHLHNPSKDKRCVLKDTKINEERSSDDLKEFLHEFLHDISPSLNVFMNARDFLPEDNYFEPEFLDIMETSFDKIRFLIDELSIYLSPEKLIKDKEEIELYDYFNELRKLSEQISQNNKRQFFCTIPNELHHKKININKSSLDHIFINLITNAVKYSRKKVGLQVSYDQEKLEVGVFDDGENIDRLAFLNHDGINYREINNVKDNGNGRGSKIINRLISKNSYKLEVENSIDGKYIKVQIPNE